LRIKGSGFGIRVWLFEGLKGFGREREASTGRVDEGLVLLWVWLFGWLVGWLVVWLVGCVDTLNLVNLGLFASLLDRVRRKQSTLKGTQPSG
jgi:hypothetical protein